MSRARGIARDEVESGGLLTRCTGHTVPQVRILSSPDFLPILYNLPMSAHNTHFSALLRNMMVSPFDITRQNGESNGEPEIEQILSDISEILPPLGEPIKNVINEDVLVTQRTDSLTQRKTFRPGDLLLLRAAGSNELHGEIWTRDALITLWLLFQLLNLSDNSREYIHAELKNTVLYSALSTLALLLSATKHEHDRVLLPLRFGSRDWKSKHQFRLLLGRHNKPFEIDNRVYKNTTPLPSDYPVDLLPLFSLTFHEMFKYVSNSHVLNAKIVVLKERVFEFVAKAAAMYYGDEDKKFGFVHTSGEYSGLLISGTNSFWEDSTVTLKGRAYGVPNVLFLKMLGILSEQFEDDWAQRLREMKKAIGRFLTDESHQRVFYAYRMRTRKPIHLVSTLATLLQMQDQLLMADDFHTQGDKEKILQGIIRTRAFSPPARPLLDLHASFRDRMLRFGESLITSGFPMYHTSFHWPWIGGITAIIAVQNGWDKVTEEISRRVLKIYAAGDRKYPEVVNSRGKAVNLFGISPFANFQTWTIAAVLVSDFLSRERR